MDTVWRIIISDYKRVIRDPFLIFMVLAPLIMAVIFRIVLPYLNDVYQDTLNLQYYYPVIIAFISLTPTLYIGATLALQVVEEKEENIMLAIQVTPASVGLYFGVRLIFYTLLSTMIVGIVQMQIGLLGMSQKTIWIVALCVSLQTPMLGLIVASFASNQLEGMVGLKASSFLILPAVLMFFVPAPWHYLCGILPGYWPIYAFYIAANEGTTAQFYTYIVMGLIFQSLAVAWLYKYFKKSV